MKRFNLDASNISNLIQPETDFERFLLSLPEFREGLLWGEPRFGHPEGKVVFHVREVLDNIDRIPNADALTRERLRIIAISHDTFKYSEDKSRPRDWTRHHGAIARKYLEPYTNDRVILDVTELHDDAYYAWRKSRMEHAEQEEDIAMKSLNNLTDRVGHCLQLYYLFFKCDTQTGDKTQASWKWFEKQVAGIEIAKIKEMY